jgi:hypothetical protein
MCYSCYHAQPTDHGMIHPVAPGDGYQRFTGVASPDSFGPLVWSELALAAELDTVGQRPLTPFASALTDKLTLELCDGSQECAE